uniref:Uncharacterized protein n=1 Tax=Meloidogyne incognita TaxID=6306 RepID=A0A914LF12_MELIC
MVRFPSAFCLAVTHIRPVVSMSHLKDEKHGEQTGDGQIRLILDYLFNHSTQTLILLSMFSGDYNFVALNLNSHFLRTES